MIFFANTVISNERLSCPKGVFYTATGNPTKYCVLEILSNILCHMEYSSDYAGGSAGYPNFSIAYLSVVHITLAHPG